MNERMNIWRAEKIILLCFLLEGVFCRHLSISLPEKIEALSGSCVIIKCTFDFDKEFDNYLNENDATGLWLKDGTNESTHQVFNSRDPKPNHFNGKITGKLHEKDCTTVFYNVSSKHNGTYYFRIKSGDLRYTYKQNFSTINVIESPPKRRVQLSVEQKEVQCQEEVLEGSSVRLRCSAETLCSSPPPTLTWSSTPRIPLSESSRLQELISDLNFTATHREDGVTFTCTITYQLQDKNKTEQDSITLHVQYSPKNTAVSVIPSSSVLEGSSVTLICSSDANPAVLNYTWSRESEGQLKQLQTGDTLTFNRTDPTHRGWYHCTAQNQHGHHNSSVMLDIQYAPKISPFSSCSRTDVTVCFCEADGNPSPELKWHLSGRPVTNSSNTFISEERLSSTGLRSSITLHQSFTNSSTLQCVSRNTQGTARQLFNLLHFTPQVSGFHHFSFWVGAAGGATVMMVFCGILLICARRESNTRRYDGPGLIMNDWRDEDEVYASSAMLSPNGAATQNHKREPLHYASIDFSNFQPESEEIRGISSLTTDYAVIRCDPGEVSEAESAIRVDQPNSSISSVMKSEEKETILEQEANIREEFSQPAEDTTYESITI
ncbi:myelin-associated glycoprotein-like [Carassius auratus]|uniref:Myelin-associated glycoprotein-like n=1 Tax=Carassius auratus TaxID=7957 RepID=A0A6P6LWA6_CARAU|nr:myelin-associated glycoprotein-like [Carassius auratus]XP_026087770.1 myelin-associated glycoprotein-like [Carassius auratus]